MTNMVGFKSVQKALAEMNRHIETTRTSTLYDGFNLCENDFVTNLGNIGFNQNCIYSYTFKYFWNHFFLHLLFN